MRAADGRMPLTDVADTEQLFRLIQSVPSLKAEPFKHWMASVAAQRIVLFRMVFWRGMVIINRVCWRLVIRENSWENGSFFWEYFIEALQ